MILMRLVNRMSMNRVAERKWRQGGLSNGWERGHEDPDELGAGEEGDRPDTGVSSIRSLEE